MSSDKDEARRERERVLRDAMRAGFIEVDPNVWVRASMIEMIRAPGDTQVERGAGCAFSVSGCDDVFTSRLSPAQLLREVVALLAGRLP